MEKYTVQEQKLFYLAVCDRASFERLMFGHDKLKESIDRITNAIANAQKSFERYKITVQKAKRREMYKRHFNKKRA